MMKIKRITTKQIKDDKKHFLLFPQYILPYQIQIKAIEWHLFCRLQML